MPQLILLRHGQSVWNEKGLWTGHTDVELSDLGRAEARQAAEAIKDITIHKIHVSDLLRAQQTMEEVKNVLGLMDLEHRVHQALKERHYGIYTGQNKWQIKEQVGEEQFQNIRRGWDVAIPEGESLKDVHARVLVYYQDYIFPDIANGHNTLIVAHGNSLRALVKHIENLSDQEICQVEIATGQILCYELDQAGKILKKEWRIAKDNKN